MSNAPIPVFINPAAGRGKAGRRAEALSQCLQANGLAHAITFSRSRGDLEARVLDAVNDGASRVIVAGGDGSVNEAVNGLLAAREPAALGVISIGTGNDFAKGCGLPRRWRDAAAELAQRIRNKVPAHPIDIGQMNERYFANAAGVGLDGRINSIADKSRLPFGSLAYLAAVLQGLRYGVTTPRVRIQCDALCYDGPVILASISNGNWIGGMFKMAPMASNDDAQLELVFAKPAGTLRILRLVPKLMRGTHIGQPEVVHAPISACEITAESPMHSHLDGEVQALASAFSFSLLPARLPLL